MNFPHPPSPHQPSPQWHAPTNLLERFAADPASVDEARASSLEAHLVACATCRSMLNGVVGDTLIADSWNAVADVIDRPTRGPLERLLGRVGVPDSWARLLGATPGLSLAWATGVVAVTTLLVVASLAEQTTGAFLVLAPLLPLVAVAAAFAPAADPAGEAGVATPMHGLGLIMRRAVIVLATVFIVLGVADVAMGSLGVGFATWALPSLAMTATGVALATWYRIEVVVTVLTIVWLTLVGFVRWRNGIATAFADSATFGRVGQQVSIAVLVVALAVLTARRDRFQTLLPRS